MSPELSVTPRVPAEPPPHSSAGSLLPRYRSGIRGYMKAVVLDLLRRYLQVETQFQHGEGSGLSGGAAGLSGGARGSPGPAPQLTMTSVSSA